MLLQFTYKDAHGEVTDVETNDCEDADHARSLALLTVAYCGLTTAEVRDAASGTLVYQYPER
jgi:hypothetical protein